MRNHKIIVFVKNKLITLDTVIPILVEMKDKYNISSEVVVFDDLAHEAIGNNIVLKDAINYVGGELFITRGEKVKTLRLFYVVMCFSKLLFHFVRGAKILHFGHLNVWPLKLIAKIFNKNTYQLQSTAYDFNYPLINIKNKGLKAVEPLGKNIVIFGKRFGESRFSEYISKRKIFFFGETRTRSHWIKYIRNKNDYYFNLYHRDIDLSNGAVIFILGTIDGYEHKRPLFESTIKILSEKFQDIPVLLKPHAYTEIDIVKEAIASLDNFYITYLHPSVLATRAIFFISNNFSNVLADAHSFGVTTIEYSKYSVGELLSYNNNSIEPEYVDYFINNNPNKLSDILNNDLPNTYCPSIFNGISGGSDELLISLASK
jgi:hypothetical protein